ncbi:RhuM family protein [Actinomyces gerencseriae]
MLRGDVTIGKNYLTRDELDDLGRPADVFLDLAESRAHQQILVTMEDRATRLDTFLDLDDRQILDNASRSPKPGPTSTP